MNARLLFAWVLAWSALGVSPILAQPPTPAGMPPILTLLFQDHPAFSAQAQVQLLTPDGELSMVLPLKLAYRQGDMRTELDMTQIQGPALGASTAETLRQIGMHQVVTLSEPSRRRTLILYPAAQAYVDLPDAGQSVDSPPQSPPSLSRKTKLGEETVLGDLCAKSRITILEGPGKSVDVLVWESRRQRQFPIQIQMKTGSSTMTLQCRDITWQTPQPDLFEIPNGYRQYEDVQSLMQEITKKLLPPNPDASPK